ncbi:MAG TPA: putative DNA binding domain-containing protein [Candidatus Bacteroides intestinavium]|uniref:DNA binding domain-containing protein n=1 Tax=Candidatus Bacteroides intestinavium TaxID=2838469 RepID=A0A9D2HQX5_9BACE|nr:putative DNA binding domain-containing protein [Candidatus Bacteroides intestinavium]
MNSNHDISEWDVTEYINTIITHDESADLEFKTASGGFPKSLWETYSAFANTDGGIIILGIRERNGHLQIEGLTPEQIQQYKKQFWNDVNNPDCVSYNLLVDRDVIEGEYEGKKLLLIRVPRATRSQRPVYCTSNPFRGHTYKRNNEGDYKCTNEEVKRMLADADDAHPQDSRILTNYSIDDIDTLSLKQYRQYFTSRQPAHPWLALTDIELLEKLGGYRKDRELNMEGFTLAGILMFGKTESITDPACVADYFPDFREYLGDESMTRWSDRICPDGTWEANLFQFYRRVYNRLITILPRPFRLEQGIRQDDLPTHVAIREALVNTLIHCDYSEKGSIVIEQRRNKLLFRNPGTLLISRNQYYNGGESICRNKSLQKMFMMIGFSEKAGSGVNKIMQGWQTASWTSPYVNELNRPDRVELILPLVSLFPEDVHKALIQSFGSGRINSLKQESLLTLATCFAEGSTNNDRLQHLLNMHPSDITGMLRTLCTDGFLISDGKGRGTTYQVNMQLGKNVASSGDNVASSENNVASSKTNVASSEDNVASNFKKKRLPYEEITKLICSVATDYLFLEEIATAVGRNVRYLNNKIIPRMIEEQKLERLYPNIPNHPKQKYKTKK